MEAATRISAESTVCRTGESGGCCLAIIDSSDKIVIKKAAIRETI
jgi:hypothetical protein